MLIIVCMMREKSGGEWELMRTLTGPIRSKMNGMEVYFLILEIPKKGKSMMTMKLSGQLREMFLTLGAGLNKEE